MFLFNNVDTTGALHAIKQKQAKHMKLSIIDKKNTHPQTIMEEYQKRFDLNIHYKVKILYTLEFFFFLP